MRLLQTRILVLHAAGAGSALFGGEVYFPGPFRSLAPFNDKKNVNRRIFLGLALSLLALSNARAQDRSVPTDSVYTWFVAESAAKHLVLVEASQFDPRFYRVFMDSVVVDDVVLYRLLLGKYPTRYSALGDQVAIPLPLRERASLLRLPGDRLVAPLPPDADPRIQVPNEILSAAPEPQDEGDSTASRNSDVNVYIDCEFCDMKYVRREVAFVNWVREQTSADVHVLVTGRSAGAGREYTFFFVGLRTFSALVDTLQFVSSSTDTDDERRGKVAQTLRLGLVRYVARTPQASRLRVVSPKRRRGTPVDDPWKSWTFRISGTGSYDEQAATRSYTAGGSLDINKVTDHWKVQITGSANYSGSEYEVKDRVISSSTRNARMASQAIRALGERWSAGLFTSASTSSFRNTNLSAIFAPAIEFNVFPYTESNRREFRLSYYLNLRARDYEDVTVFGKTAERLLENEFQANVEFTELWGSAFISLSASNYLTDFDRSMTDLYRLDFYAYLQVRLVRGLSFWADATVSRIRDQLYLPLKSASDEEILLGTIQLPTDFSFAFQGGISFTFGSIYNNVVNARFGS